MTYSNSDPKPPKREKRPRLPIRKTAIKVERKPSGEKILFTEIWNERPHVCEQCGTPIRECTISNFDHVKPKGKYPELRLEKTNIRILCFDCHYKKHNK